MKRYQTDDSYQNLFKWALVIGFICQVLFISIAGWLMFFRLTSIPLPGGHFISNRTVANYFFSYESYLRLPPQMIRIEPELRSIFRNQNSQTALPSNIYCWVLDKCTNNEFYREKQLFLKRLVLSLWLYLFSLLYIVISMFKTWKILYWNFIGRIVIALIEKLEHGLNREMSGENEPDEDLFNARKEVANQAPVSVQPYSLPAVKTDGQVTNVTDEQAINRKPNLFI